MVQVKDQVYVFVSALSIIVLQFSKQFFSLDVTIDRSFKPHAYGKDWSRGVIISKNLTFSQHSCPPR